MAEGQRARIVVVDPIRSETAAQQTCTCDPTPALTRHSPSVSCISSTGMADSIGCSSQGHVQGYEEVEALVTRCTPDWGEKLTGVPSRLIEEAAGC